MVKKVEAITTRSLTFGLKFLDLFPKKVFEGYLKTSYVTRIEPGLMFAQNSQSSFNSML